MTSAGEAEASLAKYSELTRRAMEEFLPAGQPYEYLYELMRDYPERGGKGIRPALLLASCEAFGGRASEAVATAVGLELLHNAFLIHDDIEDNSPFRRHRPTLHELHGTALALNAGDALAALALQPLRADTAMSPRLRERLVSEFVSVVRKTTEGQALDLGWRRDGVLDVAPMDYIALAGKKTCWYTTVAPLRMGAIIGSHGTAALREISRFGFFLGLAFQVRDDLLDIDEQSAQGKSPLGDIREGKHTLLLIHLLLTANPSHRAWLVEFLANENLRTASDCARVLQLMDTYGSIEFAESFGAEMVDAARGSFPGAFAAVPESEHLNFLRGLIDFMQLRRK